MLLCIIPIDCSYAHYSQCRTTMARIKQVLNERRVACLGAAQLLLERGELTPNSDDGDQPTTGRREQSTDATPVIDGSPAAKGPP